jgi:hypothetical protein
MNVTYAFCAGWRRTKLHYENVKDEQLTSIGHPSSRLENFHILAFCVSPVQTQVIDKVQNITRWRGALLLFPRKSVGGLGPRTQKV